VSGRRVPAERVLHVTVAADATCPLHEAPATDTCSRCGRFVCVTCQRLRDADVFCEACRASVPDVVPLRGWMMLAGLSLLLTPIAFVTSLGPLWSAMREQSLAMLDDPGSLADLGLAAVPVLGLGVLSALAVFTLPKFFAQRRAAPGLVQAYYLGTFVLGLFGRWAASRAGLPPAPAQDLALLSSLAWLVAFRTSNDVQRVFVK
jgi:hypothetical protein